MLQELGVMGVLTVHETIRLFRSSTRVRCPWSKQPWPWQGSREVADQRVMRLSGGQRQRLYFALAICGNPEVLFLDEPTVGIDVEARRAFLAGMRGGFQCWQGILLTPTSYLRRGRRARANTSWSSTTVW